MAHNLLDILLVEDNHFDAELTLTELKDKHLANRVTVLKDGEEAVKFIFQKAESSEPGPDLSTLILLDMRLPKIDGPEILKRIRSDERTKDIPVIALMSSSSDKEIINSYNLYVNSLVVKPVEFESLANAVAEAGLYWGVLSKARD